VKLYYKQDIDFDDLEEALKKRETTAKTLLLTVLIHMMANLGMTNKDIF
jgi:hypothetical protein